MKLNKNICWVIFMLPVAILAQFIKPDSAAMHIQTYKQNSIYLQESVATYNHKIIQGGLEYRAGRNYKHLPDYLSLSPKHQNRAEHAIQRMQRMELILLGAMAASFVVSYQAFMDHNPATFQVGVITYLTIPFMAEFERVRLKNELSRIVYNFNGALLE